MVGSTLTDTMSIGASKCAGCPEPRLSEEFKDWTVQRLFAVSVVSFAAMLGDQFLADWIRLRAGFFIRRRS
jgi:hypothetical protein